MEPEVAGDPMSDLKWTRKTTQKIAEQLQRLAIHVSARTVARLLKGMRFSLRVNHKTLESGLKHPPPRKVRNQQFQYIEQRRRRFARGGDPVISVDTKKKELVGRFKNAGATWRQQPDPVKDHDFRNDALGLVIPYGIHDTLANKGWVEIGTSSETPAFAVDAIVSWWKRSGSKSYPQAKRLLILADCGGANSARARAWKYHLASRLAEPFKLKVTVCHYPPGASKWNPIEHRLFSQITKHWAGKPLESYETVLKYIRRTATATGLRVRARLTTRHYEKGERIPDRQMDQLHLRRHIILPTWNYTLAPGKM